MFDRIISEIKICKNILESKHSKEIMDTLTGNAEY